MAIFCVESHLICWHLLYMCWNVPFNITWNHLNTPEYTWNHLKWSEITWHLILYHLMPGKWPYFVLKAVEYVLTAVTYVLKCTLWHHLKSPEIIWNHLKSPDMTWHLILYHLMLGRGLWNHKNIKFKKFKLKNLNNLFISVSLLDETAVPMRSTPRRVGRKSFAGCRHLPTSSW